MKKLLFFRKHFFAGMLVVIPLGVISWIISTVWQLLSSIQSVFPNAWQPEAVLGSGPESVVFRFGMTVIFVLVVALGISFLGWASKQYLGGIVLDWIAEIIERIPVIRSVYSALDQLLRTLAVGGGQQFSRVVYVEYPRKGIWSLAFVTGPATIPGLSAKHLHVFIPTTPNPTSGFHLIVLEEEVKESHLRVEEAFKMLLSLGIAQPGEHHGHG